MRKLRQDLKSGTITLEAEHTEDLFTLSQLIEESEIVEGTTIRKIKLDRGGEERKAAIITRPVRLSIEVKTVTFTGDGLRILGTVTEGKEDIPRGSHHTISLEIHERIIITKSHWPAYMIDKIDEACAGEPPRILIVNLDRDEAYFALMRRSTYEIITHLTSEPEKKANKQPEKDFYQAVASQIQQYNEKYQFEAVVLSSPAFFKDETAKKLTGTLRGKTILCTCSSVGKNGIDEVLKRAEVSTALSTARVGRELAIVDSLLIEVGKEHGKAAYGLKAVEHAGQIGAIETLLVTEALISRLRAEGHYRDISHVMNQAESTGAKVWIISSDHDGGKRLDGIGGIGALLRYATYTS